MEMHAKMEKTFKDESEAFFAERRKWKSEFVKTCERQDMVINEAVQRVKKNEEVVVDVDVFMKRITEIQMISQLVMNENIKDLKSINLYGSMPIHDMIKNKAQLDHGLDGKSMDPQQRGRYMDMVKIACLNFHQSKVPYKEKRYKQ